MIPRDRFEQYVAEGLDLIPERFRQRMDNVVVVVEDEPTPAQRRANDLGPEETLLGLYEGVPLTERGADYGGLTMPDKVTIFQRPIEEVASSTTEIPQVVADTVWHEIAHHFGMDEDDVRAREAEREDGIGA